LREAQKPVGRKGLEGCEAATAQAGAGATAESRKARFAAFCAANAPKFRIGVKLQMGFGTGSNLLIL
ncbi:MAG: hypothetical protein LBT33_05585, partial [Spirochaetia bacterium]|nr:hypothetical protein [Spirochaetia bacterium]